MSTVVANSIEATDPAKQDYRLHRAWGVFSLKPTNTLKGGGLTSFTDLGLGDLVVNLANTLEQPHGAAKSMCGLANYLSAANPVPAQDMARVTGTSTVHIKCCIDTQASLNDWYEGSFGVMA